MEDILKWKTTSNGNGPQMEIDLKQYMGGGFQWKTTSNGRGPLMEDDLQWKIPLMED